MSIHDVIIVGSGIAALTIAERLATDKNVIIFTKSTRTASNSFHAQGGVAASIGADDHWSDHYQDTLNAGCQHHDLVNLQMLIQQGAKDIFKLAERGMLFDQHSDGTWNLGQEGGHLKRRILHAGGDATGKALIEFMLQRIKNKVTIMEDKFVVDLVVQERQCMGVTTKDATGKLHEYLAVSTILTTGGCGQLYSYTSNDKTITGDGIAMAYRAGVEISDMEFIQFHPTLLYDGENALGLVSEAVRGEGAVLVNSEGHFIMDGIHELKDLAPRDVVARAIFNEMRNGEQVYLSIENVSNFAARFPTINRMCIDNKIDLNAQLIPVIPGAHFMIGGIKASPVGKTSMTGLYAVGEVACTGVHGANRIASNSLLEGIVFGNMTAEAILANKSDRAQVKKTLKRNQESGIQAKVFPTKTEIQKKMMEHVGVLRNEQGLLVMKEWLERFEFLHVDVRNLTIHHVEVVNMLTTAWLITMAALERKESRGTHYRSDFPTSTGVSVRDEKIQKIQEEIGV